MLLKVQTKLVNIFIFILFLVIKCKGSTGDWGYGDLGYNQLAEEPTFAGGSTSEIVAEDEDVHGGTTQPAEGDLEKELIKLMNEKIGYFGKIKNIVELKFNRADFGDVRDDLNVSFNVYKICKDVKRYFQKEKKSDAKEICKKFIKSFDEFVKNTNAYETFKKPEVTNEYSKEDAIAMFNALNSHEKKGSSEIDYEAIFAPETTATSSEYMPVAEYHEKKKGLSLVGLAKLTGGLKRWAKKITGKKSGSREKGKTIRLGGN